MAGIGTRPVTHNPVHPTYRPDIDGLRAVAVLSVVAYHAFPALLPGGFIGVDVFFVIAATYLLGWMTLLATEFSQLGKHIAGGATFTSNLLLWQESRYFDDEAARKPLLHLWSLGVEEQFYVF